MSELLRIIKRIEGPHAPCLKHVQPYERIRHKDKANNTIDNFSAAGACPVPPGTHPDFHPFVVSFLLRFLVVCLVAHTLAAATSLEFPGVGLKPAVLPGVIDVPLASYHLHRLDP